ncbi:MAG: 5-deoxy-glucuronate isomerase [Erysipelotrichaceae bacterium]
MKIIENDQGEILTRQINLENEEIITSDKNVETGILLLSGHLEVLLNLDQCKVARSGVFQEKPIFIHISKGDSCSIKALESSEVIVVEISNEKVFDSKIYFPNSLEQKVLTIPSLNEKDKRTIVDIVNYDIEPKANIVIGEVVSDQGSWSSYPPHSHKQPEKYIYKFTNDVGFGISIVGEEATIVKNDTITVIPGNVSHPQVCAPGYKMYYAWIIRNYENDPWTKREYQLEHKHLLEDK